MPMESQQSDPVLPAVPKELAAAREDCFRLLVECVKDYAIFMLDPDGYIRTWNVGAERIKGYRAAEVIGRHYSCFYPEEDIRQDKPAHELEVARATGKYEEEGWRLRKDGSRFLAHVTLTALRDEAGTLRGFAKVTRDVTERRQVEEALRRSQDELEAKVQQRTAELMEANARLAEQDRRKNEFLAMLAHELRNPLAPLRNGLHILQLAGASSTLAEQTRVMMDRQVQHLKRLLDDLLEVSRIMRGRIELKVERIDVGRVVRAVAEDYCGIAEAAGLTLSVDVAETPLWVRGDATRLTQVLANLLDNAVKFSSHGGRITIAAHADPHARRVVLLVRDNGTGISAELLPRLFDPFSQADQPIDRPRGGLGLGLTLIKGLVDLHGGEVEAFSAGKGQGAEFIVRLPREEEPAALTSLPGPTSAASTSLRVLVIEDNRDAADSLRILLELRGCEVRVAYTGPDGVRAAQQWHPEVILCDIGLPGLDGYGVAQEVQRSAATAKTRLIAITGYGQDQDRLRSHHAGFSLHLTKPVDPEELWQALARPGA